MKISTNTDVTSYAPFFIDNSFFYHRIIFIKPALVTVITVAKKIELRYTFKKDYCNGFWKRSK